MGTPTWRGRETGVSHRTRDAVLLGLFAVWATLEQLLTPHRVPLAVGLVLTAAVLVPVTLRRRRPFLAAALLAVLAPVRAAVGGAAFADVTPLQVCVVVVWAQGRSVPDRLRALVATVLASAGVLGGLLIAGGSRSTSPAAVITFVVFFGAVHAAGVAVRRQSDDLRSERDARQVLERERERRVLEAVEAERSRIARELHDLVAHGVAAVFVQAGAAERWLGSDVSRCEVALRSARQRARIALAEMRRLLSVLRVDDTRYGEAGERADRPQSSTIAHARRGSVGLAWPALAADVAPALFVLAAGVVETAVVRSSAPLAVRLLGAAAFGLVVLGRRMTPLVAALAFAAVVVVRAADHQFGSGARSPTVVLLLLGWSLGTGQLTWPRRVAALVALEAGLVAALPLALHHPGVTDFVVLGLLPPAACGAGAALRRMRADAELEHGRHVAAAQDRDTQLRHILAQERTRVARDLHDVVAHSLSIISVQAGAAEALARRDPARARESIRAVLQAAHQALLELRQLLDVLEQDDVREATHEPQPALADIADLVDHAHELGLRVDLVDECTAAEIPAGVQLTAYRIVQEALTNAHKHSGSVAVDVHLSNGPGDVEVEVRSAMTAGTFPSNGTGQGIVGMRERARVYGGKLEAGPDGDGHWVVHAVLPLEREQQE